MQQHFNKLKRGRALNPSEVQQEKAPKCNKVAGSCYTLELFQGRKKDGRTRPFLYARSDGGCYLFSAVLQV